MLKDILKRSFWGLLLGLAFSIFGKPAHAYITSAILEFCADDEVGFNLNGSKLVERSEFGPFDYQCISTADGTLPLELFKNNEENIFGVENFDTEGGSMNVSYRLTVYHSDGDPVVLWSDANQSKFLHLAKEEKDPLGWPELNFDDSKWGQAVGVLPVGDYLDSAKLIDSHFANLFGAGYVPYLSHRVDSLCRAADHNLFRTKFRFPNNPAKVQVSVNPSHAAYGQSVTVRLIPGPDTTELSQFNLMGWLPANLQLTNYAPGAQYDPNVRRISWKTSNRDMRVSYAKLNAVKIVSANGWGAPEKVLGPPKSGKNRRQLNIPDVVYNDGAIPTQGIEGWFKMDAPKIDFSQGIPKIQGVIFHSQIKMGGRTAHGKPEVDKLFFNYSLDGRMKGAMKRDVNVARTTWEINWFDGYYDASEDRVWTWDDVKNLMVKFEARQIGNRDKNLMASVTCVVRYYYPNLVAPWFQAKVLERACTNVQLAAGVFRFGEKAPTSDTLTITVNEGQCAPTPAPTLTNTPVPIVFAKPQPTSTPVPIGHPQISVGLGCLSVSPDPMDYGGAFLSFCLKQTASVSVTIYTEAGKGMRRIAASEFRAAESSQLNQIFFNGLDDNGVLLPLGRYLCELRAEKGGYAETRNTYFNMVRKRPKK